MILTQTGAIVTEDYDEPTTNADGSPLNDLGKTRTYLKLDNDPFAQNVEVPATSPQGGGHITVEITVPVLPGESRTVTTYVTALDLVGNESVPSAQASLLIDRLAPAPPV
jgi:hypothetical protein